MIEWNYSIIWWLHFWTHLEKNMFVKIGVNMNNLKYVSKTMCWPLPAADSPPKKKWMDQVKQWSWITGNNVVSMQWSIKKPKIMTE